MDHSAVEKIAELAAPNIVTENGYKYTDKTLSIISRPQVKTIELHSLDGLVQLLIKEHNDFASPIIVKVESEDRVVVYSSVRVCDRSREIPYICTACLPDIEFNYKRNYETMMIMLKSKFIETEELLELVKLIGTITDENSTQMSDDGFTQNVVVKKGIALKDNKAIKPIVKLKPYRTFLEVEQPESEFLVRLSEGGCIALYEADGGAWKMSARENVAIYLRKALSTLIECAEVFVVE